MLRTSSPRIGDKGRGEERRGESRAEQNMPRTYGFRTRASKCWVGLAPTSLAKCRVCKQCVGKGDVRLVALEFVCPGKSVKLVYHARCVTTKLARAVLDVCGSVDGIPISADVSVEEQRAIQLRLSSLSI